MKIAIIGGGGRVGSNAAYALQCAGIVRDIALVDVNAELAAGEALDLRHGASLAGDQTIHARDLEEVGDSDIVCITAGSRRKPEESRLDLINRNVAIFRDILDGLKHARLKAAAILLVVSNPVDILTRLAVEHLDWPEKQVIGLGTLLDTIRFQSIIADARDLPPTQVKALILGEHGESMLPIWSSATAGGLNLAALLTAHERNELFERTRGSGAQVIRGKGGAGYAVGLAIAEVVHAVALDRRRILPVSTRMTGQYQMRRVCLSLPTVVGREGVLDRLEVELWPKEAAGLQASARTLEQTWSQLG